MGLNADLRVATSRVLVDQLQFEATQGPKDDRTRKGIYGNGKYHDHRLQLCRYRSIL